jgi:hypothetical protein
VEAGVGSDSMVVVSGVVAVEEKVM